MIILTQCLIFTVAKVRHHHSRSVTSCIKMSSDCSGCSPTEYDVIAANHKNNKNALSTLISHGVVPASCVCPNCGSNCYLREDQNLFQCNGTYLRPKTKKKQKNVLIRFLGLREHSCLIHIWSHGKLFAS